MFQFFLSEYKKINSSPKKIHIKLLTKCDIILIVTLIISSIVLLVFQYFKIHFIASLLAIIMPIIVACIDCYNRNKHLNLMALENASNYKSNRIKKLVDLCNNPTFNLYDKKGVDFLISMCNKKLNEETIASSFTKAASFFFNNLLYPVIAFIGGFVISKIDGIYYIINISIQLILLMIICFFLYMAVKPLIDDHLHPNKEIIENLRDDLEYIKLEIE
ncbi:hypothetical protein [Hominilimicola sp.]|uniref:hypothetical protein n=1 Tax=Hominilimicola sp. TaxID=3073571 RepID=UPI0039949883